MLNFLSRFNQKSIKIFSNISKKSKSGVCKIDNPYTLEKHSETPYFTENDIKGFLEKADSASTFLNSTDYEERINICNHVMKWFLKNKEKIAVEMTNSMGKPITQARKEVVTMIDRAENLIKIAPDILKDDNVLFDKSNLLKISKEPIGTSLIISPWNYPLICCIGAIIPSIICGNSVLLKHSPRTPMMGKFFEEAFNSVGALNVVQNMFLENADVRKVYSHQTINYVGFTGSVEGGKAVLLDIAKAERFLHTNFELGGKDAAYVCEDADIDFAVDNIVDGALYNSGQSCCAVERVYVHHSKYDLFIEKAAQLIATYKLGNPLEESTTLGPLALPDAPLFLKDQIDEATGNGAEVVCGGSIVNDSAGKGRFFEPTLLKECRNDMMVMTKESFGPILPVAKVETDDEAIEMINNSEYGLTAAIYSKDYKKAQEMAKRIKTGTVFLNRCDYLHPLLAHSGRKNSGVGNSLSKYGFYPFVKLKSYNFRLMN